MGGRTLSMLLSLAAVTVAASTPACSCIVAAEGCERDEHCREGYRCVDGTCREQPGDAGALDAGPSTDAGEPADGGPTIDDAGVSPTDGGPSEDDGGPPLDGGEDAGRLEPDAGPPPVDVDPSDGGPLPSLPDGGMAQTLDDGRDGGTPLADAGPPPDAGPLDDGRDDSGAPDDDDGGDEGDDGSDENGRPLD